MGKKGAIAVLVAGSLLLLTLFLPSLLSSRTGKEWLVRQITPKNSQLQVRDWTLSWFGDQKIEGLLWKDSGRGLQLSIENLIINRGLISLLADHSLGQSTASGVKLIIQKGTANRETAHQESSQPGQETRKIFHTNGSFKVDKGQVTFVQEDGKTILIEDVQLLVQNDKDSPFTIDLSGKSKEGEESGSFIVHAELAYHEGELPKAWLNPFIRSLYPDLAVEADVRIENFPTQTIDQSLSVISPIFAYHIREAVGPRLNLNLTKEIEKEKATILLHVDAENLKGGGKVVLQENEINLAEPFKLNWKVTPAWFARFASEWPTISPLELSVPGNLELSVRDLKHQNNGHFNVALDIDLSPVVLQDKATSEKYEIEGVSLSTKVDPLKGRRELSMSGSVVWRGDKTQVNIQGTTFGGGPICLEDCLKGEWNIALERIPLALVNQIFPNAPLLSTGLGQFLNATFQVKEGGSFSKVEGSIETDNLKAPQIEFLVSDNVSLQKPFVITYHMPEELKKELDEELPLIITKEPVELTIESLSFPFDKLCCYQFLDVLKSMQFKANMVGSSVQFDPGIPLSLKDLRLTIDKEKGKPTIAVAKAIASYDQSAEPLFGQQAALLAKATLSLEDDGGLLIDPVTLHVESSRLEAHITGRYQNEGWMLDIPATLTYTLTPDAYRALNKSPYQPTLLGDSHLFITIDPLKRAIEIDSPLDSHVTGSAKVDQFLLKGEDGQEAHLKNLGATFNIDGVKNLIAINGRGDTWFGVSGLKGKTEIAVDLFNWHDDQELTLGSVCMGGLLTLDNFPTALLSPYLDPLYPYLTDLFSIKVEGEGKCGNDREGSLFVTLNSPVLSMSTHFKVADDYLRLFEIKEGKNEIKLHINPETFCQMLQQGGHKEDACTHLYLKRPFDVSLVFNQLFIPNLFEDINHSLYLETILSAAFTTTPIELFDSTINQHLTLQTMKGQIEAPTIDKPVTLSLTTAPARKIDCECVQLKVSGLLNRHLADRTKFSLSDLDGSLQISAKQLPLGIFSELFFLPDSVQEQVDALLGNSADIASSLEMKDLTGLVSIDLAGSNSSLHLKGGVEGGILHLSEPLKVTVDMTPSVAKSVIGEIVPLLQSAVKGKRAITIEIDNEGFSLPLFPLNLMAANVPNGVIDLYYLELKPEGELGELFTLLKIISEDKSSLETIWFTPLYFSFSKGVLTVRRVDLLLSDRYPLALWGTLDFVKDRVNLELGLGARTLDNAFGLSGLPADYILPLPIRGSTEHPKIDKTRAGVKIGTLIAELQNSAPGQLIGGILDLITSGFREEKVPPPTTDPLPWDTDQKPRPSKIKSLFKTIEKGAQSIKELLPSSKSDD